MADLNMKFFIKMYDNAVAPLCLADSPRQRSCSLLPTWASNRPRSNSSTPRMRNRCDVSSGAASCCWLPAFTGRAPTCRTHSASRPRDRWPSSACGFSRSTWTSLASFGMLARTVQLSIRTWQCGSTSFSALTLSRWAPSMQDETWRFLVKIAIVITALHRVICITDDQIRQYRNLESESDDYLCS